MSAQHEPRGHALLLVLTVIAALAAVGAAVAVRLSVDIEGRRADERRVQALWLARSAASLGRPGSLEVITGADAARVSTRVATEGAFRRVTATAVYERYGTATVDTLVGQAGERTQWRERYQRALPRPESP